MKNSAFCINRLVESGAIAGDIKADIRLEVSQLEVAQSKEIGTSVSILCPICGMAPTYGSQSAKIWLMPCGDLPNERW
jgi:hypothetical protein